MTHKLSLPLPALSSTFCDKLALKLPATFRGILLSLISGYKCFIIRFSSANPMNNRKLSSLIIRMQKKKKRRICFRASSSSSSSSSQSSSPSTVSGNLFSLTNKIRALFAGIVVWVRYANHLHFSRSYAQPAALPQNWFAQVNWGPRQVNSNLTKIIISMPGTLLVKAKLFRISARRKCRKKEFSFFRKIMEICTFKSQPGDMMESKLTIQTFVVGTQTDRHTMPSWA